MSEFYDEKGKVFTPRVTKRPVPVVIQTLTHRIVGEVHVRPDWRLLDEINQSEGFLAVTQAEVLDARGQVIYRSDFLSVNCAHIVWLFPKEAPEEEP